MGKISINISSGEVDKEETVVVGIDLGTTNSLVAYTDDSGDPIILSRDNTSKLVPSVIFFDENDEPVVGSEAHKLMVDNPSRTIFSIKRLMGKSFNDVREFKDYYSYDIMERDEEELVRIRVGKRFYTPIELSAIILKELKSIAEEELGKRVDQAVITVPAYFNDSQRQATKDAGRLAGLDVLRIINEPTAASLAYGLARNQNEKTIAVYDLGGGTFDLSILHLSDGVFEVLSTHGDTFLGGDDFDRKIAEHWIKQLEASGTEYELLELRLLASKAKHEISANGKSVIEYNETSLEMDSDTFFNLTRDLVERTMTACRKAIADADTSIDEIDEIILVGGSTRMPVVRDALESFFDKKVNTSIDPDEAVAMGAAIQADILSGKRKDMLLLDVTPLSLGIETMGGLMDVIIPRNSKIPAAVGRNYTTSVDGQKNLRVTIFQGERDLVEHNRKLGEFILSNIPPMAAGLPKIEIKFLIDADGILQVVATELRSGVRQEIEVRPQYGITEDEMAKMLLDSISHAGEDMSQRALIEARTEASQLVNSAHRFIDQNSDWLSEKQISQIEELTNDLKSIAEHDDKDKILQAIEALNDFTAPLAHEALDKNIAKGIKGEKI